MKTFLEDTTEFPPQGKDVPTAVRQVCERFDWICYSIDYHPGNVVVVTFDDARFEGEPHALFEMGLAVVERMAKRLARPGTKATDPWHSLFSDY